jgi:hypothetical protein
LGYGVDGKFFSGWIHQWQKQRTYEKNGGYCHYNQSALGQLNKTTNIFDIMLYVYDVAT